MSSGRPVSGWRPAADEFRPARPASAGGRAGSGLLAWIRAGVESLYPGYFALVMATGIVSNGFFLLGQRTISDVLLGVNLVAFPLLAAATLARSVAYPRRLWADLVNPRLVFTFFTVVAAADVLGFQLLLRGHDEPAVALWLAALVVWIVLGYFSFSVLTFVNSETGADIVHGGWLIAIVGTESLVLLGTQLAPLFGSLESLALVGAYGLWGVGIAFYGIFITLFSYRIFFLRIEPPQMLPLFWVVMGAAAIAANAGSALIVASPELQFLRDMKPFVDGTTLILWAWATWWIPLLVVFGVWRHAVRRFPLTYHPMYWSIVFPLGMYAVATYRFALAADFTPLRTVAEVVAWVSLAAWALTSLALLGATAGGVRAARAEPAP